MNLTKQILRGNKSSISKTISLVENNIGKASDLINALAPHIGRALRIGITGPPGVGKSTIVDAVTSLLRKDGNKVGIVAIDPTSPFTGGALLGDRIRMSKVMDDDGVFIRSMATRGSSGGLARATYDTADILDASGKNYILIETVGTGQADIDVSKCTDCVVVVFSPESGDGVQAMKSGLMEIADIVAINKADRPGADKLEYELRSAYEIGPADKRHTPIILTEAQAGKGIDKLVDAMREYITARRADGRFEKRRKDNITSRIKAVVEYLLQAKMWNGRADSKLEKLVEGVLARRQSVYEAAERMLKETGYGK